MEPLEQIRILAIDWSGDKEDRQAAKKICVAGKSHSRIYLQNGRTREQVFQWLLQEKNLSPYFVVGFDFAFSYPAWFVEKCGCVGAVDFWRAVEVNGERWLGDCAPPFWGRKGTSRPPAIPPLFRATEQEVEERTGARPKSVFQIAGGGAVGTASIRGMPFLSKLRAAGFSIWPFDNPSWPLVVEIFPRAYYKEVVRKRVSAECAAYVRKHHGDVTDELSDLDKINEDAFDALISLITMMIHSQEFLRLGRRISSQALVEGEIWLPSCLDAMEN